MTNMATPDALAPAARDVCAVGVLRHLRLDADLSIRQLSDLTGINKGRLSVIERGANTSAAELHSILDAIYLVRTNETIHNARWTHRHDAS